MINYYQPFLWPFLHWQRSFVPGDVRQSYWLSFEDALWELLPQRGIAQGSLILVPDFYCLDVVENIQNHGYKTAFYQLNDQFQIQEQAFKARVIELQPTAVILFHAAGLQCKLVTQSIVRWLGRQKCLVIEDCVHRLIDPTTVRLFGSHHLIMDSLRKVSPLPGSMVYELQDTASAKPVQRQVVDRQLSIRDMFAEYLYQYQAMSWYGIFQLTQLLAVAVRSAWLMRNAHQVILKKHDDLVGDSQHGYAGWGILSWVHSHVNHEKIGRLKETQIKHYTTLFSQVFERHSNYFYQVTIPVADAPRLHVYPVGLHRPLGKHQLNWLHQQGVVVWPKFPDSPWATNRGVLFLPLGYHVSDADITQTAAAISRLPDMN